MKKYICAALYGHAEIWNVITSTEKSSLFRFCCEVSIFKIILCVSNSKAFCFWSSTFENNTKMTRTMEIYLKENNLYEQLLRNKMFLLLKSTEKNNQINSCIFLVEFNTNYLNALYIYCGNCSDDLFGIVPRLWI